MQITCVVGLPGSGKTHYVRNHMHVTDWLVDDPLHLYMLPDPEGLAPQLVSTLWICDPYFCIQDVRHKAELILCDHYAVCPSWVFFENDPEACMRNVTHRDDGRKVRGLIHALKSRYQIPTGATVLPVWQPTE